MLDGKAFVTKSPATLKEMAPTKSQNAYLKPG
jgi:hypothetical protein